MTRQNFVVLIAAIVATLIYAIVYLSCSAKIGHFPYFIKNEIFTLRVTLAFKLKLTVLFWRLRQASPSNSRYNSTVYSG